jgi:hypothetical protein
MTSIQHDSALEEAAAALNLKGVKMSDILAATEREEAKKRKPELYHRSDTSVDAGLASTAPTGAKLERKKTMRELAQEEEAAEAAKRANARQHARRAAEATNKAAAEARLSVAEAAEAESSSEFALVDEGGALRFKTDKKPVAAPPKVDHTAALLKEASSATKKRAEAAMAKRQVGAAAAAARRAARAGSAKM